MVAKNYIGTTDHRSNNRSMQSANSFKSMRLKSLKEPEETLEQKGQSRDAPTRPQKKVPFQGFKTRDSIFSVLPALVTHQL